MTVVKELAILGLYAVWVIAALLCSMALIVVIADFVQIRLGGLERDPTDPKGLRLRKRQKK